MSPRINHASGLLDILSSDYYPASLLDAASASPIATTTLRAGAQAVRLVSKHPAQALGLHDRGVIAEGNAPIWCSRTAAASTSIDHVWRQERGSLHARN